MEGVKFPFSLKIVKGGEKDYQTFRNQALLSIPNPFNGHCFFESY